MEVKAVFWRTSVENPATLKKKVSTASSRFALDSSARIKQDVDFEIAKMVRQFVKARSISSIFSARGCLDVESLGIFLILACYESHSRMS